MKKFIVITTIFNPSEAVRAFASLPDYRKVVIGDMKSPKNWHCEGVDFISVDEQKKLDFTLNQVLPYNHYCRKMLGYLIAIREGAEIIVDTDDDNIPKNSWGFPSFDGSFCAVKSELGFVNIYQLFTSQSIWPRGLPLDLVSKSFELEKYLSIQKTKIGIWQGLADEDPDVDAIYRLTSDAPCFFNERAPVVLLEGTVCPFNTQNTAIRKELYPLLYLPTYVTFRYTDILRGLIAQPIMWLYDYRLGFTKATVVQKRNPHDYMKDFISEIPMYESCSKVINIVSSVISAKESIETNIYRAYESLLYEDIVSDKEMICLEHWLNDLQRISG